jgi:hypothetical protein
MSPVFNKNRSNLNNLANHNEGEHHAEETQI